jgi:hypothetical protein
MPEIAASYQIKAHAHFKPDPDLATPPPPTIEEIVDWIQFKLADHFESFDWTASAERLDE